MEMTKAVPDLTTLLKFFQRLDAEVLEHMFEQVLDQIGQPVTQSAAEY